MRLFGTSLLEVQGVSIYSAEKGTGAIIGTQGSGLGGGGGHSDVTLTSILY